MDYKLAVRRNLKDKVYIVEAADSKAGDKKFFIPRNAIGKKIGDDLFVRADAKTNCLTFLFTDNSLFTRSFKMRLTNKTKESRSWEVKVDEEHWDLLMSRAIFVRAK